MMLACNDFAAIDRLLERWRPPVAPRLADRAAALQARAVA
jgi:hypothetical protein